MTCRISIVLMALLVSEMAAAGADNDGWLTRPIDQGNFNPFPDLPYEATSIAQDELIAEIRHSGGNAETNLKLIEELLAELDEESCHPELLRWAAFYRIRKLIFLDDGQTEGLAAARAWLKEHPESPYALNLRALQTLVVTQRFWYSRNGVPVQRFSLEEIQETAQDLFDHHDPHHYEVIRGHHYLARAYRTLRILDYSLKAAGDRQDEIARDALIEIVNDPGRNDHTRAAAQQFLEERVMNTLHPKPPKRHLKLESIEDGIELMQTGDYEKFMVTDPDEE